MYNYCFLRYSWQITTNIMVPNPNIATESSSLTFLLFQEAPNPANQCRALVFSCINLWNFVYFDRKEYQLYIFMRRLYNYITCRHSTSRQVDLFQRSFKIHFFNIGHVHHCIFTECGQPKEMMDGFSIERESTFFCQCKWLRLWYPSCLCLREGIFGI
jgi:hypothetical protein